MSGAPAEKSFDFGFLGNGDLPPLFLRVRQLNVLAPPFHYTVELGMSDLYPSQPLFVTDQFGSDTRNILGGHLYIDNLDDRKEILANRKKRGKDKKAEIKLRDIPGRAFMQRNMRPVHNSIYNIECWLYQDRRGGFGLRKSSALPLTRAVMENLEEIFPIISDLFEGDDGSYKQMIHLPPMYNGSGLGFWRSREWNVPEPVNYYR